MEETVKQFGIQWPLLVTSIINFVILLLLLKKFLYKPIIKTLEDRKNLIDKSLAEAKKIEADKEKTEERIKASLKLANEESMRIISSAKKAAEKNKEEILVETDKRSTEMLARAREEINQEKEDARKMIRTEAAELIRSAMQKIAGEKVSGTSNEAIQEVLEKVNE